MPNKMRLQPVTKPWPTAKRKRPHSAYNFVKAITAPALCVAGKERGREMKGKHLLFLVFATLTFGGCSPESSQKEMPVVNDENCKPENIVTIEDKAMREQFASMCLRRSNFRPSPKKGW